MQNMILNSAQKYLIVTSKQTESINVQLADWNWLPLEFQKFKVDDETQHG